jgi:hypothetical protein
MGFSLFDYYMLDFQFEIEVAVHVLGEDMKLKTMGGPVHSKYK